MGSGRRSASHYRGIFGFVLAIEVVAGIAKLLFYVLVAALVVLLGLGVWTDKKIT